MLLAQPRSHPLTREGTTRGSCGETRTGLLGERRGGRRAPGELCESWREAARESRLHLENHWMCSQPRGEASDVLQTRVWEFKDQYRNRRRAVGASLPGAKCTAHTDGALKPVDCRHGGHLAGSLKDQKMKEVQEKNETSVDKSRDIDICQKNTGNKGFGSIITAIMGSCFLQLIGVENRA